MRIEDRANKYIRLTVLITAVLLLAYVLKIAGIVDLRCPVYTITGMYCPGCGITRAFNSLIHLEIHQAFRYNAFMILSIPYYIYLYIRCGKAYIMNDTLSNKENNCLLVYAVAIIVYGILRNFEVFKFLAPTII